MVGAGRVPRRGVTATVHDYLDVDAPARDLLDRGCVNLRALARWLIDTHALDATEEAVVSAIRRYPAREQSRGFQAAHRILKRSHVNSRSNVCAFTLPRTARAHEKLSDLFRAIKPDRGQLLRIIEGERAVKVVFSGSALDRVEETLGRGLIQGAETDLAEYHVVHPGREAEETHGVLALMFSMLAVHRINVIDAVSGPGEYLILVADADALKTYQVLNRVCSGDP